MPLNATPEFNKAMEKYSSARTIHEKIAALQEALSELPKHKGAENMRAFLLRRLAELKKELERRKKAAKGGKGLLVSKEGFQAVLFGFPNSGKSYVLRALTGAPVDVTDYPLSTTKPTPGIMVAKGGRVQLVEVPSYFQGYEDSKIGRLGLATIRGADAVVLVVDARQDPVEHVNALVSFLRGQGIFLNERPPNVKVERRYSGGIVFAGESFMTAPREVYVRILQSAGFHHASVTFLERTPPERFVLALDESARFLPAVVLLNRGKDGKEALEQAGWTVVVFEDPEGTKEALFRALGLMRVYTKPPRGKPSEEPVVLRAGSTVKDLARMIRPRAEVRSARVWGSTRFPGQTVGKDYVLRDGDIVEIHFS